MTQWIVGLLGITVTLAIFTATAVFHLGRLTARVDAIEKNPPLKDRLEAMEKWRETIRHDMHEISDILERVGQELKHLSTLIEERTERRTDHAARTRHIEAGG